MTDTASPGAAELRDLTVKLHELLKVKTLPVGMKLFETVEEMEAVPGIRRPKEGRIHTTCQLVTQARWSGFTMGITADNVRALSNCGGVIGLCQPDEPTLSGERMNGIWFENQTAACAHQTEMVRVPHGKYQALAVSPLRMARLDPPDIVLFYATPGQMIIFVNGLQWKRYKRYDMTITGETACSDSWGRALAKGETSISVPCFAERRYGGVSDEEMAIALPPDEFARGIEGMEGLSKAGLRYPIPPYSPQTDPSEGMAASYG